MRLAFAGTPAFAKVALQAVLDAGHDVVLVLTQPDRAAGRGLKPRPSEVKALALDHGLPVLQPASLKHPEPQHRLAGCRASAMVVAAYGLILPQSVLDLFPLGCLNIHASLLPRWRGAAPIQRAILAGDRETGICVMRMDAGLDTGPVFLREAIPIGAHETSGQLHDRLAVLGAQCIVRALEQLSTGSLQAQPQPEVGVTYAGKLAKQEAALDWRSPAEVLDRQVRAFDPFPGAFTALRGEALKVWRAEPAQAQGPAGLVAQVGADRITVACGRGGLDLLELQRAGGRRLPVREFLQGCRIEAGERLGD
jgi:methionyl-tRNA formyltransferase